MVFVRDTLMGRPAQSLQLSAGLAVAQWTPGMYEHLTDEDVTLLDKLTKKILSPSQGALPNHRQTNRSVAEKMPANGSASNPS